MHNFWRPVYRREPQAPNMTQMFENELANRSRLRRDNKKRPGSDKPKFGQRKKMRN